MNINILLYIICNKNNGEQPTMERNSYRYIKIDS